MARTALKPPVPMNQDDALRMRQGVELRAQEADATLEIDHMPQLGGPGSAKERVSLMPKTGGYVGITYAIVPAYKVKNANDIGWRRPPKGSRPFTIVGPRGAVNCEVVQYGKQIYGVSRESCRPDLLADSAIWDETGLDPDTGRWPDAETVPEPIPEPEPQAAKVPKKPSKQAITEQEAEVEF